MPVYPPNNTNEYPLSMDVFEDSIDSSSSAPDKDWKPTSHLSKSRPIKSKPVHHRHRIKSEDYDSICLTKSIRPVAIPYISDATELLSSSDHGLSILLKALDFSPHLYLAKSDAGEYAGNGLYIVAKNADLVLKKGQIITWFDGKVVFADKDDPEQNFLKNYSISLGHSITHTAPIILSNPMDFDILGCAHFTNHSKHPNCKLEFVEGMTGIMGAILVLNKDITLPSGKALELVFNYGKTASTLHGLSSDCVYDPKPKLMELLRPASPIEIHQPDFFVPRLYSTGSESQMFKRKSKTVRIEYTPAQMSALLAQYLPESSYKIIASLDDPIYLAEDPAEYYFMELNPELNAYAWIFMYFNRQTNTLCFFDPEGLLLSKIKYNQFNFSGLINPSIQLCHSWFIYSKYKEDIQYQKTGAICIELAKNIFQGLIIEGLPISELSEIFIPGQPKAPILHMNIKGSPALNTLGDLLVPYPEKKPRSSDQERARALSSILAEQQSRLMEPQEFRDDIPMVTEMAEPTLSSQRTSPQFFEDEPFSALKQALLYYQSVLGINIDDITILSREASIPQKKELQDLCLKLVWNEMPGDKIALIETAHQILSQLKNLDACDVEP